MVDDAASADGRALSRRAVLTGAAGLVGLVATTAAGCSVDNPVTRDDGPAAPAALAPDVAVATRALAEIRAVAAAVEDTATRFPAIRTRLAPLAALHRTHEASLADAVPDRATSAPSPSSSASPSAPPPPRRTSFPATATGPSRRWRPASSGCTTASACWRSRPRAVTSRGCSPAWVPP